PAAQAVELISTATPNFPSGMVLSGGLLSFSEDGDKLFLTVAPAPAEKKDPKKEASAEEKVVLDLWHWKDDFIPPMQQKRGAADATPSFRAGCHLREKKFVKLGDKPVPNVSPTRDGRWATGTDDKPYRVLVGYDANYLDHYLVNTNDGSRKPLLKKHEGT